MTARRVWLLVVAAVVVFAAGVLLTRTGSSPAGTGDEQAESDGEQPATDTTAPGTGSPAIPSEAASDVSGDEDGAVSTALELASVAQDWLYLSDEDLDAAVRSVAAPVSADRLVEEVLAEVGLARDALARSPGRVWWVVNPLAWRVDTFTSSRAQVSVWTVSVLSAADVAMPQSDWTTTAFDLEWQGDRWRLVSMNDTLGPTPQVGGRDQVWEPEPFDDALVGFTRVGTAREVE